MFPFNQALDHARRLVEAASAIEIQVAELRAAQYLALFDWRGPHAETMRDQRIPEEVADLEHVAIAGLRREASQWADAWRHETERFNQRQWHQAELTGASMGAAAPVPPTRPRPVPLPVAPDFTVGPAFARYELRNHGPTTAWSIDYGFTPA